MRRAQQLLERHLFVVVLLLLLLVIATTGKLVVGSGVKSYPKGGISSSNEGGRKQKAMNKSEKVTTLSDFEVGHVIGRLIKGKVRPSDRQWELFRNICQDRGRKRACSKIFEYFRLVLVPLDFPNRAHVKTGWSDISMAGLPKVKGTPELALQKDLTYQYGDDSCSLGDRFIILSDGITRDPDSDFFSYQVVEFLRVGISYLSGDLGDSLVKLVASLSQLIVQVQLPGAATLSLALLSSQGLLYVATLGDSEVKVLRSNKILYRSPLQRDRNKPGQLNARRLRITEDLNLARIRVRPGDMIVVASDGLWDNVFEKDVASSLYHPLITTTAVSVLMRRAIEGKESPHKNCNQEGDSSTRRCIGSRRDDITIVVAKV